LAVSPNATHASSAPHQLFCAPRWLAASYFTQKYTLAHPIQFEMLLFHLGMQNDIDLHGKIL